MAGAMTVAGATAQQETIFPAGTLTERLADYWSSTRLADVPADKVRLAKCFLIDAIAAGIAGSGSSVADIAVVAAGAAKKCDRGTAVLWGRDRTLPGPWAALINATAAHALELDDFGGCGHSGAVVVIDNLEMLKDMQSLARLLKREEPASA